MIKRDFKSIGRCSSWSKAHRSRNSKDGDMQEFLEEEGREATP